jgi:uncharacterized protein (DUF1501 family)
LGDWGLVTGDWLLGIGICYECLYDFNQSPIPSNQSPITNPQSPINQSINQSMNRRNFLKDIALNTAVPVAFGKYEVNAMSSLSWLGALSNFYTETDHVLVLVQLSGGNDGLNTLIPLDQYGNYANARQSIKIPENEVLKLNGVNTAGFHPKMTGMQQLFNEGQLKVVQAVGFTDPSFSHFRSTDIWMTGSDSNQNLSTGWVGRYLQNEYPNFPGGFPNATVPDPLAVQIGAVASPVLQAATAHTGLSIESAESFRALIEGTDFNALPNTNAGKEVGFIRALSRQTNKYGDVIQKAARKVPAQSSYPSNNPLADQLKIVAKLIAGGLKTRVYLVNLAGFDTHSGQFWRHADLLNKVSEGIAAFTKDLKFLKIDKRVLGMTFSEFGRRIVANGSLGTDHGTAAPLFLFGTSVEGGIMGNNPTIAANVGINDNIPMQYDFRSVYASVLEKWFCLPPTDLQKVLLKNYQSLPILKANTGCISPRSDQERNAIGRNVVSNYPNPFADYTTITFEAQKGHNLIQIFDVEGRLLTVPVDGMYEAGKQEIIWDSFGLPLGTYYARFQSDWLQQVRVMLKVE